MSKEYSKRQSRCMSSDSSDDDPVIYKISPRSSDSKGSDKALNDKEIFVIDCDRHSFDKDEPHKSEDSNTMSADNFPAAHTKRLRIRVDSHVQKDVEKRIKICPGLEHITEIRRLIDTIYVCGICNKTYTKEDILRHLESINHRVKSLKALEPKLYRRLREVPKRKRKSMLYDMLEFIQQKEGIGKIVVVKDYSNENNYKSYQNCDSPGTNSDNKSCKENPNSVSLTFSKIDYFCDKCECYMFENELWESHKKRLLKSLKKHSTRNILRIEKRPKSDAFLTGMMHEEYSIISEHNAAREPIVGLDFIKEFQHVDDKSETYHCVLCADCFNCITILSHLISLPHRRNYLEQINHFSTDYVNNLSPNDNNTYFQVADICRSVEKELGTGCPEVYVIKRNSE